MKAQRLSLIVFFFLNIGFAFSQWNLVPSGTSENLVDICFPTDSIGYAVSDSGTVLKTTDQGTTWNTVANLGGVITSVCSVGTDTVFAGGNKIYRSDDGGSTWSIVSTLALAATDLQFFNAKEGLYIEHYTYSCGTIPITNCRIYATSDYGLTWQYKGDYMDALSQFQIINDSSAYVFGTVHLPMGGCAPAPYTRGFKTTNRGQVWYNVAVPGYNARFSFVNDTLSYLMTDAGRFYKMNGASTVLAANVGIVPSDISFINRIDGYLLSGNNIYTTSTEGVLWDPDLTHPSLLNRILNDHKKEMFAIGVNGVILKKHIIENLYPDSVYRIVVLPDSVNFNEVTAGAYKVRRVKISNKGNMNLNVSVSSSSTFQVSMADSVYSPSASFLLLPQKDTFLAVRFLPSDTLWHSDSLVISSTNTSDVIVSLKGKGTDNIAGVLSGTHTYCGGIIKVTGEVVILPGAKIIICPGTTVLFMGHYGMQVYGILEAIGLRNDSIVFTPYDKVNARWNGIQFYNNTSPDTSVLRFCSVEYCKTYNLPSAPYVSGGLMFTNYSNAVVDSSSVCYSTGGAYYWGQGIFIAGSSPVIRNNKIYNNSGRGIDIYSGGPLILNNEIYNNRNSGIFCSMNDDMPYPRIIQNVIFNNMSESYGGGIYCFFGHPSIINNTICNNYAFLEGGGIYSASSSSTHAFILNDIVYNNTGGEVSYASPAWGSEDISFCNVQGGYTGIAVIDVPPQFVDPTDSIGFMYNIGSYNWAIKQSSLCIDAGDTLINSLVPMVDFAGADRYWNGRIDIGAYEYPGAYVPSVNEIEGPPGVGIYPNPFDNVVNIEGNDASSFIIVIYDLTSRKLMEQWFTGSLKLNMEGFTNGVYIYSIEGTDGSVSKGKLVKQSH
ncbi:MAG: Por secretion system C-terminal sorting protein [Bacteroidetes bacterium]|nr:Por secretion system C-terminal sorting protein [Bacteroidota bacterium]